MHIVFLQQTILFGFWGRSPYWDGPRASSPGQSLASPGFQSSRKHECTNLSTELGLKSVTTTTKFVEIIENFLKKTLVYEAMKFKFNYLVSFQKSLKRIINIKTDYFIKLAKKHWFDCLNVCQWRRSILVWINWENAENRLSEKIIFSFFLWK